MRIELDQAGEGCHKKTGLAASRVRWNRALDYHTPVLLLDLKITGKGAVILNYIYVRYMPVTLCNFSHLLYNKLSLTVFKNSYFNILHTPVLGTNSHKQM